MIFASIKKKTSHFFLNKKLRVFKQSKELRTNKKIKTVFFLTDDATKVNFLTTELSSKLNVSKKNILGLIYAEKTTKKEITEYYVRPKDFNLFGKIKSANLKRKLTNSFDLLINYCKIDNIYTNQLILQCKSNFNIGLQHQNKEVYDLIINCAVDETKVINLEIKKYLTILKRIG